ncbi:hypothetical protein Syun_020791 [Stephania yunnanensis]|uniref:Uncharacterized protein n=1 Tax=Stephania yunnanensis TaxID=152371 RepID=A0AAP0NQ11_9MAGN
MSGRPKWPFLRTIKYLDECLGSSEYMGGVEAPPKSPSHKCNSDELFIAFITQDFEDKPTDLNIIYEEPDDEFSSAYKDFSNDYLVVHMHAVLHLLITRIAYSLPEVTQIEAIHYRLPLVVVTAASHQSPLLPPTSIFVVASHQLPPSVAQLDASYLPPLPPPLTTSS